jgi:hypothetical protein
MKRHAKSKRIDKKKKKNFILRSGIGALFIASLYGGFYLIADSNRFQIEGVRIEGNESLPETVLHDSVIKSNFNKQLLFPDQSYLTMNRMKFKDSLLDEYPVFSDIDISFQNGIMNVEFIERKPIGVWCYLESGEGLLGETCHFFDDEGVLYNHAPSLSGGSYLKIVSQAPKNEIQYGRLFVTKSNLIQYQNLIDLFDSRSIKLGSIELYDAFDIKAYIHSMYGQEVDPDAFLFIDRRDLDIQSRDLWLPKALLALSRSSEFIDELFSNPNNFEYVDLRFRGRLYYRFSHFLQ